MKTVIEVLKELNLSKGIYVIHGPEEFLHKKFLNALRQRYKNVSTYYGEDIDTETFKEILGERSLFGGSNSVNVLLKAEKFFSKLRGKKQKENIANLLKKPISNIVVISIERELKKSELSKEPFKTLFSTAREVFLAKPLDKKKVASLILKKLKAFGITPEKEAVQYLLESFSDLSQLSTALEKLITYKVGGGKLTLSEVKELIQGNPSYTVYDFQSAFFGRDLARSLKIFEGLLEGLTTYERNTLCLQLEGLLLNTLNRLLVAIERTQKGEDLKIFSKSIGLYYPFQVAQFKGWLQKWETKEVVSTLRNLYKFDRNVKVKFLPAVEEFRKFISRSLERV